MVPQVVCYLRQTSKYNNANMGTFAIFRYQNSTYKRTKTRQRLPVRITYHRNYETNIDNIWYWTK
jgi:multidrug resistance efflux pump